MLDGAKDKKEGKKKGWGQRISRFLHIGSKSDDTDAEQSAHSSVEVEVSTLTPARASPRLKSDWVKTTEGTSSPLPAIPTDPLPLPPSSDASSTPHSDEKLKKVKKEKKDSKEHHRHHHHRRAEGSARKHHRKEKPKAVADSLEPLAAPVLIPTAVTPELASSTPSEVPSSVPTIMVTDDAPRSDLAPVDEATTMNERLKKVQDELGDLDVPHTPRTDYLMAHDPHALQVAGILRRTNSGRRVLESEGTNTHPLDQLPGHPLHPSQQRLEWVSEREAEEEKRREATKEKKKRPGQ